MNISFSKGVIVRVIKNYAFMFQESFKRLLYNLKFYFRHQNFDEENFLNGFNIMKSKTFDRINHLITSPSKLWATKTFKIPLYQIFNILHSKPQILERCGIEDIDISYTSFFSVTWKFLLLFTELLH